MHDLIRIHELEVWAAIGVPDAERAQPQRLHVSLEMRLRDIGPAASTDNVRFTVDYAIVAQRVTALVAARPRRLIETLAEEIAADLLKSFPILSLALEIKKYVLPTAQHVSITIERPKPGRETGTYRPTPSSPLRMARPEPPKP